MRDDPEDPFADLPYNGVPIDEYGVTARQAMIALLENEQLLSDEQFEFVASLAGFHTLSPKQEQALLQTWRTVQLRVALRRARSNRKRRSKQNDRGEDR